MLLTPHPRLDFTPEHFVEAFTAIDHGRRGFALLSEIDAQRRRGWRFDVECAVGGREQYHTVILTRRFGRDFAFDHVALHHVGFALERIAPAAAAGSDNAHNLPGLYRFAVNQPAKIVRMIAAGVDGDAKGRAGF